MKITQEKQEVHGGYIKTYLCNGVKIATHERVKEWFCTVDRAGRPSNIRDRMKICNRFSWNYQGLKEVLGEKYADFEEPKVEGPDLRWGFTGEFLSLKQVKEILNK